MPRWSSCVLMGIVAVVAPICSRLPAADGAPQPAPFEFRDGDRVVLLGNTLIEREQKYGRWEALLTSRFPERNVSFRNLGWDGDTVWAESRGIFDPPAAGYARMIEQVKGLKPTVVFLGYGANEAFAGAEGMEAFLRQYEKLLDDLTKVSAEGVRFVLLSPVPLNRPTPAYPDPGPQNRNLREYSAAIQQLAERRGARFLNLMDGFDANSSLLRDGVHLNDAGYEATAKVLQKGLGWKEAPAAAKPLRDAIIAKNELYFHSWRPQNVTYLFGFRKHEQGQNAKETEEFAKLVKEKEAEIATLKKGRPSQ